MLPLFFALVRFEPLVFELRAEEPEFFVERFDDEAFDAFEPLFDPPRAEERELFDPLFDALLREAGFLAPLLLVVFPELLPELLLLLAGFLAPPFPELLLAPLADRFAALFFDPEPPRLPPPSCLLTVAQARRSASSSDKPRLS